MTTKAIEVRYSAGHTIKENWALGAFFCPACGKKSLAVEQGDGDYYEGSMHLCTECGATFSTQCITAGTEATREDKQRKQLLNGLPPFPGASCADYNARVCAALDATYNAAVNEALNPPTEGQS